MAKTANTTELTLTEAAAIAEQARAGNLETTDPEVRRVIGDANRLLVRTQMWGEAPTPHRRRTRNLAFVGFGTVVLIWVIGLMVPLLTHVGGW